MVKKRSQYHMNTGAASVLLVLVVCALTVFSVLSMRASYHEMKLAEKTASSVEEYYLLDSRAEEFKMRLIQQLSQQVQVLSEQPDAATAAEILDLTWLRSLFTEDGEQIFWDPATGLLTYRHQMEYNGYIEVIHELDFSKNVTEWCNLLSWRMIREEDTEAYQVPDESDIWDGEIILID